MIAWPAFFVLVATGAEDRRGVRFGRALAALGALFLGVLLG
jgi:hypothetical protein